MSLSDGVSALHINLVLLSTVCKLLKGSQNHFYDKRFHQTKLDNI